MAKKSREQQEAAAESKRARDDIISSQQSQLAGTRQEDLTAVAEVRAEMEGLRRSHDNLLQDNAQVRLALRTAEDNNRIEREARETIVAHTPDVPSQNMPSARGRPAARSPVPIHTPIKSIAATDVVPIEHEPPMAEACGADALSADKIQAFTGRAPQRNEEAQSLRVSTQRAVTSPAQASFSFVIQYTVYDMIANPSSRMYLLKMGTEHV